jgi:uncharacterized protein YdiU (UPF0061 family)
MREDEMMVKNVTAKAGWNLDNSYARLPNSFYTRLDPTPVRSPELAVLNERLTASLGLESQALRSEEGVAVLAGNRIPDGATPIAQAYAGHQFGHFTMLGDGRAILIGEQITPSGERFDIQLKGSGPTPYSRGGDGRAALGPMLREYIISEAMHALGIPTTRSLAVVTTGETLLRETVLPGAILTRVASSHIRVGTFQFAAAWGTPEDLRTLADYTLGRHYPEVGAGSGRYLGLLRGVVGRQARLIAQWQLVGFIHGVMNTDNMAISGETIDYGPCAFMDTYNPATVFSSIDRRGRYAYANQVPIAAWNLARFAETLLPLLHDEEAKAIELAKAEIDGFAERVRSYWLAGMRAKLGISNGEPQDEALVDDLLELMQKFQADYTNTFRALTLGRLEGEVLFETAEFAEWRGRWEESLGRQPGKESETESESESESATLMTSETLATSATPEELMRTNNPAVIPRNHRVEEALEAAVEKGDYSVMERLLAVLANPFAYSPEQEEYAKLPAPSSRPYRTFCGT